MDIKPNQSDVLRPQESSLSPVDASADIIVSDDEQTAYLGIRPPANGGKDLSQSEIVTLIEKRRVIYGINADAIKSLAEKPVYNTMVPVAQGNLPVQGSDAKLTFHFNFNHEIKPRERSDGTVDYRDLGLIESVTAGQALCTLTPAVKGIPGKTVMGKILLAEPVRNFSLPIGKNTQVSEDKLVLHASIGGCVEYLNNKVNVLNVFTIKGDVSNNTGNINFDGSVIINGDVLAGFTVKASGSITVVGNVEGAVLDAGGDIRIAAGLVGQGRGKAICGGNFKALFVENAEVVGRGDVTADVFMHSQIRCSGNLIADGRKGAIIGGSYVVGKDVKALTVGTQSGVATLFELGVDPSISERIKYSTERSRTLNIELVKLNQIIQLLYPLKNADKLTPDKEAMLNKAVATKESDDIELASLAEQIASLTNESRIITSQFTCKRELYYGTKVTISQVPFAVPSDMLRCKIYLNPSREMTMVSMN